jgi:hypothetical protein
MQKIQYKREEGGFSVWIDGKPNSKWVVKGWLNNLRDYSGIQHTSPRSEGNRFLKTQIEYHGKII